MRKPPTQRSLIKKLDDLHSRVVRLRELTRKGYVPCYTCKRSMPYEIMTCGHCWTRNNKSVRFDFRNTRPQCRLCQGHENGMQDRFTSKLKTELGDAEFDKLVRDANTIKQWTIEELQELIAERKEDLARLAKWSDTK